jgi:hypothetical protein
MRDVVLSRKHSESGKSLVPARWRGAHERTKDTPTLPKGSGHSTPIVAQQGIYQRLRGKLVVTRR